MYPSLALDHSLSHCVAFIQAFGSCLSSSLMTPLRNAWTVAWALLTRYLLWLVINSLVSGKRDLPSPTHLGSVSS